jgi:hypothetical protein
MWLGWGQALAIAAVLAAVGLGLRGAGGERTSGAAGAIGAVAREAALLLTLYAFWRIGVRARSSELADGLANGETVWRIERALGIGNEAAIERWFLQHPDLMRAANAFYAVAHVPALVAMLVWLFLRHRDRYAGIRNVVAAVTALCLLWAFVPVAPPRMYPWHGFVDAGRLLGQSVYGPVGQGISNQVSALPSMHAAWALLVAYAVVVASPSRWRWWIVAHPVVTLLAIVATANHWWLDAVAAAAVLIAVLGARRALGSLWARRSVSAPEPPAHVRLPGPVPTLPSSEPQPEEAR